jgi:hypothetical protein
MIKERTGFLRIAFVLLTAISLSACGGGGGGDSSPPVASPPPPPPPSPPPAPVVNVNIDNPTLVEADNFDVSPGDTLTLVWSD